MVELSSVPVKARLSGQHTSFNQDEWVELRSPSTSSVDAATGSLLHAVGQLRLQILSGEGQSVEIDLEDARPQDDLDHDFGANSSNRWND